VKKGPGGTVRKMARKEDVNDGTSDLGSEFVKSRPKKN